MGELAQYFWHAPSDLTCSLVLKKKERSCDSKHNRLSFRRWNTADGSNFEDLFVTAVKRKDVFTITYKKKKDNLKWFVSPVQRRFKKKKKKKKNFHSGLQREKCILFWMYYAYVFLKHKGSTGGTQQEVSLRYNLFTFTHRHACKVKLNVSKPPGDETTLRPRLLYISCTITDCCLILTWFILFMCHFYIFF